MSSPAPSLRARLAAPPVAWARSAPPVPAGFCARAAARVVLAEIASGVEFASGCREVAAGVVLSWSLRRLFGKLEVVFVAGDPAGRWALGAPFALRLPVWAPAVPGVGR